MHIPEQLYYTKEHEWIKIEPDNTATVGITDFAQRELGDIVYVEVDTIGKALKTQDVFGTIEAVKTVSDLFLPISATIVTINPDLATHPELVNTDPYGKGWIIKISHFNQEEIAQLLSPDAYKQLIA